jgi:hypothetical protein
MLLTDVAALIAFRRHVATAFHQQIDRKNLGRDAKINRAGELYCSDTIAA